MRNKAASLRPPGKSKAEISTLVSKRTLTTQEIVGDPSRSLGPVVLRVDSNSLERGVIPFSAEWLVLGARHPG